MRTLKITIPLMRGDDIAELQAAIARRGYETGAIDGIYGKKTRLAVKLFQTDSGLKSDGIVGPLTWAAVNALTAPPGCDGLLRAWGFGDLLDNKGETYALKQYQAAMGLGVSGVAGVETLSALEGEIILPRMAEERLVCGCVAAGKNYCDGYPQGRGAGAGVLLLAERIMREVDKTYPGTLYYVSSAATPPGNGAAAGGYRCARWNSERGGAAGSRHKACCAMDMFGRCAGVADSVIRKAIESAAQKLNTKGGVGGGARYIVHIDTRSSRSRWRY